MAQVLADLLRENAHTLVGGEAFARDSLNRLAEATGRVPPLAPVRMKPVRGYAAVSARGALIGETDGLWPLNDREAVDTWAEANPGSRVAEVEVREVGSEPEGVPCKMVVNPEYPADKHFWYSRNHPDFPPHYIITPGRFVADAEAP